MSQISILLILQELGKFQSVCTHVCHSHVHVLFTHASVATFMSACSMGLLAR